MRNRTVSIRSGWILGLALMGMGMAAPAGGEPILLFQSLFESLDLAGGPYPVPLASDPTNALGDSIDGYGFVDSAVSLTLSSQRAAAPGPQSVGAIVATPRDQNPVGQPGEGTVDPESLNGESFTIESFFDVFVDITFTDLDRRAGRDYAGQPDGASIVLQDVGPGSIFSSYEAIFDKDAPGFGLLPPPAAAPHLGLVGIEVPLGGDINGNGEDDKLKINLGTFSDGDENRTFLTLRDGTVIAQVSTGVVLDAAIDDLLADPPFTIGSFLGPVPDQADFFGSSTTANQLVNPVPEPSALGLLWLAGGLLPLARRRRAAAASEGSRR